MLSLGIPPAIERQHPCGRGVHDRHLRLLALALRQRRLVVRLAPRAAGHGRRRHRRLSFDHDPGRHHHAVHEWLPAADGRLDPVESFRPRSPVSEPPRWIAPLGFGGGFLDAIGGGGWGPMVTSTLLGHGTSPRFTIGSVRASASSSSPRPSRRPSSAPLASSSGRSSPGSFWAALAAPIAAYAAYKMPDQPLMILVGSVIVLLSIRGLIQALT